MRAAEGSKSITKILYYLFLAYTVCAVLYTARYFYHTYTSENVIQENTTPSPKDLGISIQSDSGKDSIKWGGKSKETSRVGGAENDKLASA